MERIFDYYSYNETSKFALATASLTDHALVWWDKEVAERRRHNYQVNYWRNLKFYLRKRYVPPHYH